MPVLEAAALAGLLIILLLMPIAVMASSQASKKEATDRIASFLPTATVTALQLIISSYPQNGQCTMGQVRTTVSYFMIRPSTAGIKRLQIPPVLKAYTHCHSQSFNTISCTQRVLLWISLSVLALVTFGMAIVQHQKETDSEWTTTTKSLRRCCHVGGWQYTLARAVFSTVAFFFVSFLTPPTPGCLVPHSGIPEGSAWIVAVLLGSIMTLFALVFPTEMKTTEELNSSRRSKVSPCSPPFSCPSACACRSHSDLLAMPTSYVILSLMDVQLRSRRAWAQVGWRRVY